MDGGAEAMPLNSATPRPTAMAVTARIEMMIAPGILRAESAAISAKPMAASSTGSDFRSPMVTSVAGWATTILAFCRAMMARNRPMPAAMPSFIDMGIALTIHSRTLTQRQRQEDEARDEDRAERRLPRIAHALHDAEGEVGVEPHARRERDGIIRIEAHEGAAERGGQARRHEHGAEIHARDAAGSRG